PAGKPAARNAGRVGTLICDRPARDNAVSLDMWEAAARILADFAADDQVRVVVLTGAGGKAFDSDADISKFEDERATREAVLRYNATTEGVYSTIATFPKPTLAQIQGYCLGGGLNLAVCCDLRFCSTGSKFALPAAKLGLGYGYAGLKRYIDTIGPSHTKDIFFSARQLGADEAFSMGLVDRVLPDLELAPFVKEYAEGIASNAPLTVGAITHAWPTSSRAASRARITSREGAPSWRSANQSSRGSERVVGHLAQSHQAVRNADGPRRRHARDRAWTAGVSARALRLRQDHR